MSEIRAPKNVLQTTQGSKKIIAYQFQKGLGSTLHHVDV